MTKAERAQVNAAIARAAAKKRVVRVAILAVPPPDAPGTTAAPRLRARLKLVGTMIVALPATVQVASLNVSGKRLAQVRGAAQGKGGAAGAVAAIDALLARPAPPATTATTPTTTTPAAELQQWRWRLDVGLHRRRDRPGRADRGARGASRTHA